MICHASTMVRISTALLCTKHRKFPSMLLRSCSRFSYASHQRACTRQQRALHVVTSAAKVEYAKLQHVAELAARAGAKVISEAVKKPRTIERKEGNDIVTDTDKAAEVAVVKVLRESFPDHAILAEEGGVLGEAKSDYLWCVDPLDGTVNFGNGIPGFCVSVGVLRHSTPVAGCVIEFLAAPNGGWAQREFSAARNRGATLDGKPIRVSNTKHLRDAVVVTELVWQEDLWPYVGELIKEFTKRSRGLHAQGAAAKDLCDLAMGTIDTYYQFRLKPWDVAAGAIILEEAGGKITTSSGTAWNVFDRSMVATNDALHHEVMSVAHPVAHAMRCAHVDLGPWHVPPGFHVKTGAQLE